VKIFLDANVLFSAVKSDGHVSQLLRLLTESGHELVANDYVMDEARRNLEVKYPVNHDLLGPVLTIVNVSSVSSHGLLPEGIELAEKDRPVLAAAIALGCNALVTGDTTHFRHLFGTSVGGVMIFSPRSIAESLLSS